jgi:hypothetical protein
MSGVGVYFLPNGNRSCALLDSALIRRRFEGNYFNNKTDGLGTLYEVTAPGALGSLF